MDSLLHLLQMEQLPQDYSHLCLTLRDLLCKVGSQGYPRGECSALI